MSAITTETMLTRHAPKAGKHRRPARDVTRRHPDRPRLVFNAPAEGTLFFESEQTQVPESNEVHISLRPIGEQDGLAMDLLGLIFLSISPIDWRSPLYPNLRVRYGRRFIPYGRLYDGNIDLDWPLRRRLLVEALSDLQELVTLEEFIAHYQGEQHDFDVDVGGRVITVRGELTTAPGRNALFTGRIERARSYDTGLIIMGL